MLICCIWMPISLNNIFRMKIDDDLWGLICTSLPPMVNLKTLSITGSFCDSDITSTLNNGCCLFQLEYFRYLPENRHANKEEYLDCITAFLRTQPGIATLHLHWFIDTPFPGSCCSRLEDLRGSYTFNRGCSP